MSKLEELVEMALNDYPATRESDAALVCVVWNSLGLGLTKEQMEKIRDLPSSETITRHRRFLQSKGWYKPDNDLRIRRTLKEMKYRDKYQPRLV